MCPACLGCSLASRVVIKSLYGSVRVIPNPGPAEQRRPTDPWQWCRCSSSHRCSLDRTTAFRSNSDTRTGSLGRHTNRLTAASSSTPLLLYSTSRRKRVVTPHFLACSTAGISLLSQSDLNLGQRYPRKSPVNSRIRHNHTRTGQAKTVRLLFPLRRTLLGHLSLPTVLSFPDSNDVSQPACGTRCSDGRPRNRDAHRRCSLPSHSPSPRQGSRTASHRPGTPA